jgi:putative ABC transport system ATP-binding protein
MIKIQNLYKVFNKGTINENVIFNNLSLNIEEGDFITVIGSNGAGKSTLLNMISGNIMNDGGFIKLNNKEISNLPEHKRAKVIGRVFQDPTLGTSPSMTILENLSMAFNKGNKYNLTLGINKKDIPYFKKILCELNLGLEDMLNTRVGLLSGGQRQALSLLMATASNPKLLLLDEHTAALDPKTSEKIINITNKVVEDKKITTLMITHNLNHAINNGNRLIMMHRGEIIVDLKGKEKSELTIEKVLSLFESAQPEDSLSDRLILA